MYAVDREELSLSAINFWARVTDLRGCVWKVTVIDRWPVGVCAVRHQPGRRLAYANRSAATFSGGAIVCGNSYRGGPQNIELRPGSSALTVHFTLSGGVDFVLTIVAVR
jgi:hypothetical protein